jgi:acetylornithine deacetylase
MKTDFPNDGFNVATAVCNAVNRERLLDTAVRLIAQPSRTGEAGAAADELQAVLSADGFAVERPAAGYEQAPAVVTRYSSGRPGRTLQFNGHLDTVHLPFVPPQIIGDRLIGSGSSDMKAGLAAAVEALRAVRDVQGLSGGDILLTAHDLHEAPWGDGRQLDALIALGHVGDAVLLPEYFNAALPIIGRGGFSWVVQVRRPGPPIHEVNRPNEPSVIAVGAELVARLGQLHNQVSVKSDPMAGTESVFVGMIQSGSIYNEYPQVLRLEGTRRWLPGTQLADAEQQLRDLCSQLADASGTTIEVETHLMRDAFQLDPSNPFVDVFQSAYSTLSGKRLPIGGKPFVDDGNSFWSRAGIPAITHGPNAGGAHTTSEWVNIDDLVRVARLYALIATTYCPPPN